jgi:DNA-binding transcriptional MerR regulator
MNKNIFYSIGEVSKLKSISIKTLRYYHDIGLLVPAKVDLDTGYRYYTPDQFVILDIIKIGKSLDTPLKELRTLFQSSSSEDLLAFIDEREKEVQLKIIELNQMILRMKNMKVSLKSSQKTSNQNEIEINYYDDRYVVWMPSEGEDENGVLISYARLEQLVEKLEINPLYTTGTILGGDLEKALLFPKGVFHCIGEKEFKKNNPHFMHFPSGYYVTAVYRAGEEKYIQKELMHYISEHQLQVKMIFEIDLLDTLFDIETYSSQLQLLVSDPVETSPL